MNIIRIEIVGIDEDKIVNVTDGLVAFDRVIESVQDSTLRLRNALLGFLNDAQKAMGDTLSNLVSKLSVLTNSTWIISLSLLDQASEGINSIKKQVVEMKVIFDFDDFEEKMKTIVTDYGELVINVVLGYDQTINPEYDDLEDFSSNNPDNETLSDEAIKDPLNIMEIFNKINNTMAVVLFSLFGFFSKLQKGFVYYIDELDLGTKVKGILPSMLGFVDKIKTGFLQFLAPISTATLEMGTLTGAGTFFTSIGTSTILPLAIAALSSGSFTSLFGDIYNAFVGDGKEAHESMHKAISKLGVIVVGAIVGAILGFAVGGIGAVPGAILGAVIAAIPGNIFGELWGKFVSDFTYEEEKTREEGYGSNEPSGVGMDRSKNGLSSIWNQNIDQYAPDVETKEFWAKSTLTPRINFEELAPANKEIKTELNESLDQTLEAVTSFESVVNILGDLGGIALSINTDGLLETEWISLAEGMTIPIEEMNEVMGQTVEMVNELNEADLLDLSLSDAGILEIDTENIAVATDEIVSQLTDAYDQVIDKWNGFSDWLRENQWGPIGSDAESLRLKLVSSLGEINTISNQLTKLSGMTIPINFTVSGPTFAKAFANGGILTSPQIALVGEAGPESVIPLSQARRDRGIALWQETGEILGVLPTSTQASFTSASEGVYANHTSTAVSAQNSLEEAKLFERELHMNNVIPFPAVPSRNETTQTFWSAEENSATTTDSLNDISLSPYSSISQTNQESQSQSGINVQVNITSSPDFVIQATDGAEPEDVLSLIKSHSRELARELADDIGGELAERLGMIYDNVPLKGVS